MMAQGFNAGPSLALLMLACSSQSSPGAAAAATPAAAATAGATLATALELELVHQKKIKQLLPNALDQYEASGVTVAGEKLYVVFDNSTALAAIDTALQIGVLGPGDGTPSQFEAISGRDDGGFYVMVETVSQDDTRGQVVAFDAASAVIGAAFTSTSFPEYNHGFEGMAWLRVGGREYLLALCQSNACAEEDAPAGQGRAQLLALEEGTWVTRLVLEVPKSVTFADYSDLALLSNGDGSYRAALLSRESSALWIGTLTTVPWSFQGPGAFYSFPLSDGDTSYCSLEGVTFVGPRSLALVSDASDGDKPCNTEEESIHLFELPQ
jgi:hypothetical protein